ncbi:MAG: serine hydrolase domain-containing protein [Pseudomonadota bacterium]|nr:serine hydrolase domain-containing protein [Pseudomonadota bacterium]
MISYAQVKSGKLVAAQHADSAVPWWSFTKTVLAFAALILVRDKRLALDVPIDGYPFTLRQVLRHQAGIANYGALSDYHAAVDADAEPWSEEELFARTEADRLRYPPGEGWDYSNIGYLLVRRLIERTTQEDLGPALHRLVLNPLGVTRPWIASSKGELCNARMGTAMNYDPRWVYHGLLVGPLQDAATLLNRAMTSDLLPAHLLQAMQERCDVNWWGVNSAWTDRGYGLGVMIENVADGSLLVGHGGAGPGSVIAVYSSVSVPDLTCAVFSEGSDQSVVEKEVVRMLMSSHSFAQ